MGGWTTFLLVSSLEGILTKERHSGRESQEVMLGEPLAGAGGVEAQHIPTQPVREEPQGSVGVAVQILRFPSVNHIIFSIGIK